jgi:hypothetical protein
MRIAKSDTIAGLPAPLARSLVRKFRGGPTVQEAAQQLLKENGCESADTVFAGLEAGGYLEKFDTDSDGDVWWEATILGNALAMAGFGKPISRKTADRLVAGCWNVHMNTTPTAASHCSSSGYESSDATSDRTSTRSETSTLSSSSAGATEKGRRLLTGYRSYSISSRTHCCESFPSATPKTAAKPRGRTSRPRVRLVRHPGSP